MKSKPRKKTCKSNGLIWPLKLNAEETTQVWWIEWIDFQTPVEASYVRSLPEHIQWGTFGTRDWVNVELSTASPAFARKYENLSE